MKGKKHKKKKKEWLTMKKTMSVSNPVKSSQVGRESFSCGNKSPKNISLPDKLQSSHPSSIHEDEYVSKVVKYSYPWITLIFPSVSSEFYRK